MRHSCELGDLQTVTITIDTRLQSMRISKTAILKIASQNVWNTGIHKPTAVSSTSMQKNPTFSKTPCPLPLLEYPSKSDSSWKCVANSARQRFTDTRWWTVANAMANPSLTVV